jgi:hypothetical protein
MREKKSESSVGREEKSVGERREEREGGGGSGF